MINELHLPESLQLKTPGFELVMTILEIDRNILPSLKLEVSCNLAHAIGNFLYQADDIWIDYEAIDSFISNLGNLSHKETGLALLTCMDRALRFELTKRPDSLKIRLIITEQQPNQSEIQMMATFISPDLTLFKTWHRQFIQFRG